MGVKIDLKPGTDRRILGHIDKDGIQLETGEHVAITTVEVNEIDAHHAPVVKPDTTIIYEDRGGESNYNKLDNLPSINGVILTGNKTTEELGIIGTSMTEIDISTDVDNPTNLLLYTDKSGTYVAKNTGVVCFGDIISTIHKGGFFTVRNFVYEARALGVELDEEDNVITISGVAFDGDINESYVLEKKGTGDWGIKINLNTDNIQDFVDLDIDVDQEVRNELNKKISSNYGMALVGDYITFIPATTMDIDNNVYYRVLTPSNIAYAVQKNGAALFANKSLETEIHNLMIDMEEILNTVVTIDE
jgi:hypothetical protein